MPWIQQLQDDLSRGTLTTARASQAVVIDAVDRAWNMSMIDAGAVGRLWSAHQDRCTRAVRDVAEMLEHSYETVQELMALHREFARRIVDVIDDWEQNAPGDDNELLTPTDVIEGSLLRVRHLHAVRGHA